MLENGFGYLGASAFNGKLASKTLLLEHAKTVGATVVVIYNEYSNTIAGPLNLAVPAPPIHSSSTTQGQVGSTLFSATTQTTTSGALNTYSIPYSHDRYNQVATFWAKDLSPIVLGVYVRDLSAEDRRRLGRNRGLVILAVMKGSPAFSADLLLDDVLIRIGSSEIVDRESFERAKDAYAGREAEFEVIRGGVSRSLRVKLNPKG